MTGSKKIQPLLMRVPRCGLSDDLAIQIIERREKRDRPVPDIIVRRRSHILHPQR